MEVRTTLPNEPRSPAVARRFVRDTLANWSLTDLDDMAMLLVSELVTNAVLHARSPAQLVLRRIAGAVRVEVHDGSTTPARRRSLGVEANTGRGLALVEALASRWGVVTTAGGKYVWFELPASGGATGLGWEAG